MLTNKIASLSLSLGLVAWQITAPVVAAENLAALPAVLPGSVAQTQSKLVCSKINWLTSLDAAKEQAKKEHKLIVWIHMLGNIDGFT